jgi:hypothetical protein
VDVPFFSTITRSVGLRRFTFSSSLGGALACALAEVGPAKRHKKRHTKPTRGPQPDEGQSWQEIALCPSGCRSYSNGAETVCEQASFDWADLPLCWETADCPTGSFCRATSRFTTHCVPLCAA